MNIKYLSALSSGAQRQVDLSVNTLQLGAAALQGSVSGALTHQASATTTPYTLTWPAAQASGTQILQNDGFGTLSWVTSSAFTFANEQLSNLSGTVAINLSLLPGTDNSINLGSSSKSFAAANIHVLADASGVTSLDAYNRLLEDSGANTSVDYGNRSLIDSAAAIQLSWSTSGVEFNQLAATTVPYLNSSKILVSSAVTPTELGYVSGVTSAIQTQFSGKLSLSGGTMSGNIAMGGNKLTGLGAGSTAGDSVRYEQAILVSGVNAFSADQSMGGNKLTNLANGTASTDAVNYSQLSAIASGLIWQSPVTDPDLVDDSLTAPPVSPVYSITYIIGASATGAWATYDGHAVWWDGSNWIDLSTGNPLSSGLGTAVQIGDRYGVAIATPGAAAHIGGGLTGKANYIAVITGNTPSAITYSFTAPVNSYALSVLNPYSQHAGTSFTYNSGTSAWIEFSGPSKVDAGAALSYSGNILNVLYDNVTLNLTGNALEVKAGGITNTQVSGSAAIAYSKLNLSASIVNADINGSAAIAYSKLSLSNSIVNADINASAAIAYSKLSLSNSIVNADINSSAAIAYSKLSLSNSIQLGDLTSNSVDENKIVSTALDSNTLTGGSGSKIAVISAPVVSSVEVAGQSLSATTLVALRYAKAADAGFVAGRVYKADYDTTSADNFHATGLAYPSGSVSTAGSVTVVESGLINVPSHGFTVGTPIFLSASGAVTGTAPSTSLQAVVQLGMVKDANNIFVKVQEIGVN